MGHPRSHAAWSMSLLVASISVLLLGTVAEGRALSSALTVVVGARGDECFFEEAKVVGAKVFFHFQVTSGGKLDVDAKISDPKGEVVWEVDRESEYRVMFKAASVGQYAFCFANKLSTMTPKTVSFDIAIGDPTQGDGKASPDPIEQSIIKVTEGLHEIAQEQAYLTARERVHRSTAEETNSRVLYFSIVEIALLLVMGVGQIVYLRQQFEVKRYV
eukprot:TRINITY_DN16359_c0_g1_i2.p2 TRINITY_DN16359_c0_g1~~TRINITY_DN16359_c0_g1_i2.p2  ORF type:complete len:225 (+),score=95.21 TRINITY_DN16359_c0_g1_i2:29-676(+)